MNEMTLQDVKDVSLDILQHVHDFCVNNDIQYSIAYGTLIGAIRHKGFIPWDDDIDIIMTRPNFDKFCNLYKDNEEFELVKPFTIESYIAFGRVCDKKRTIVDDIIYPWSKNRHGLWIDIFPLDSISDDNKESFNVIDKFTNVWEMVGLYRRSKIPFRAKIGLIRKIKLIVKKLLFCLLPSPVQKQYKLFSNLSYDSSSIIGNLAFLRYNYKERYPKEWFNEYIDVDFANKKFKAIREYDKYLKCLYNDYMRVPPIERQNSNNSFHRNYWI